MAIANQPYFVAVIAQYKICIAAFRRIGQAQRPIGLTHGETADQWKWLGAVAKLFNAYIQAGFECGHGLCRIGVVQQLMLMG